MSGIDFFLPSTAWRGPAPRLALPHGDPAGPWPQPIVADGTELRLVVEAIEPLLVALYVAGYRVPEIAVMADGAGARLSTLRGTVDLADPTTWTPALPSDLGFDVTAVVLLIEPAPLASPPSANWGPLRVPDLGLDGGAHWLVIQLAANDHAQLRALLHHEVLDRHGRISSTFEAGGLGEETGLSHLYDTGRWLVTTDVAELADHELATRDLVDTVDLGAGDGAAAAAAALAHEIGPPAGPGQSDGPTFLQYHSLSTLVCELDGAVGVVEEARCQTLLTNLQAALSALGPTADYGDVSLTTALLDLQSDGRVDILGGPLTGDLGAVQAAIDKAEGTLDAGEVDLLAAHLRAGPGQLTDEAADRLSLEYLHLDDAQMDTVIDAFIDIAGLAEVLPDRDQPVGRSFERYVDTLRQMMAAASVVDDDLATAGDAVGRVHARWNARKPLQIGPALARHHYGATRLFALSADLPIGAAETLLALRHYASLLSGLSDHWRTDVGADAVAADPNLSGWGVDTFLTLATATARLRDDDVSDLLNDADWSEIDDLLVDLCGPAPFTKADGEQMEVEFGGLLSNALQGVDPTSPLGQLADLITLLEAQATDEHTAQLCDLEALGRAFDEVTTQIEPPSFIADLRTEAADLVTRPHLGSTVGSDLAAWITSDVTQAYWANLDPSVRDADEAELFENLARLAPALVESTMQANAAARFGAELWRFAAEVDEDGLTDELSDLLDNRDVDVVLDGEARALAKAIIAGVEPGVTHLPRLGRFGYDTPLAKARELHRKGKLSTDGFRVVYNAADRSADDVGPLARFLPERLGRQLGNLGAVAVAAIATYELAQVGWDASWLDTFGYLDDIAGGVVSALPLLDELVSWVVTWLGGLYNAGTWQVVATIGKVFGAGSAVLNFFTTGYAAWQAFDDGDYIAAGLYAASTLAWGGAALTLGLGLFAAGPVAILGISATGFGFIALGFGAMALIWQHWSVAISESNAYHALLEERRLVYAEETALYPGIELSIDRRLVGTGDVITTSTPLAEVLEIGQFGAEAPPPAGGVVHAATVVLRTDDDQVMRAYSPVPGIFRGFTEDPGSDDGPDAPWPADSLAVVEPFFETWQKAEPGAVSTAVHRQVGQWVEPADDLLTVDAGATSTTLDAIFGGRLVDVVPKGAEVPPSGAAARVRLEGRELEIEFAEESGP